MIFITLGSQEFQFNRLLAAVDEQVAAGKIKDEIFAQTGVSDYKPQHFPYKDFLDRDEFSEWQGKAEIEITHGGTGSIVGAVKKGKKVIAVPRLAKYGEHVDDHQLELISQFKEMNLIYECQDCDELWKAIAIVKETEYSSYQSNTGKIIESIEAFITRVEKPILIFHPDIHIHKTNNEYTKKIYEILQEQYDVRSFEWFLKHPFAKNIHALYLNWFENTIGKNSIAIQKAQYAFKYLALKWAHFRKIRICYVVHNKTPHSLSRDSHVYRKATRQFILSALRISDVIVELCRHTEIYLSEEFDIPDLGNKIALVPHGKYTKYPCDLSKYRQKYNLKPCDCVFAFVGKMDKYKNIDVIVEAFYRADIDGRLLLAGKIEPEYRAVIEALIKDERVITDFSFVSDEDMSGIMQIADAIVLPYENTSINSGMMINAFSNGTTVIGTNIEMLQDYSDELVYGYNYTDTDTHIKNLSYMMQKAFNDMKTREINIKGYALEQSVMRDNTWEIVKDHLLLAVR